MTVANMENYDALIDVGVAADKARRAAEAVGAPNAQIAGFDARLARIEADVGALKADVGVLKTDGGSLKAEVNSLKVEVAMLRGEVANLKWIVLFHGALTLVVLGKLFALI